LDEVEELVTSLTSPLTKEIEVVVYNGFIGI